MPDEPASDRPQRRPPLYAEAFETIGTLIEQNTSHLVERWLQRAAEQQPSADSARRQELVDELAEQLPALGRALREQSSVAFEQPSRFAEQHGQHRWEWGWRLDEVVRDYQILQQVVLEFLGEQMGDRLTSRHAMVIGLVMDESIQYSVVTYVQLSQQQLEEARQQLSQQVEQQKQSLRAMTLQLTEAEHYERRRLARFIHDGLQQFLVAARMKLDLMLRREVVQRTDESLEEVNQFVGEAITASRNLTTDLYPAVLENDDFAGALRWLADQNEQRHGLTVQVDAGAEVDSVDRSVRLLLFDAVRELLFNIVKHAGVHEASVRMEGRDPSHLRIEVQDRGAGFQDPEQALTPEQPLGFGLGNIRSRIEKINGQMRVDSEQGKGTTVTLEVPVEPAG